MNRKPSQYRKLIRNLKPLLSKNVAKYSSKFSKKTYDQHQLIILNCLKTKLNKGYEEFTEILAEMDGLRAELGLAKVPHFTTLQKAFQRLKSSIFNILVTLSAKLTEFSGIAAIDATGFQRSSASRHYSKRCNLEIKSQKTTFIIDIQSKAILGLHMTTGRKHDTKIADRLVSRVSTHFDISRLLGDKGYDSEDFYGAKLIFKDSTYYEKGTTYHCEFLWLQK
jgi:hypothetical protein